MIAPSYEAMGDLADRVVLACWAHPGGWVWYVVEYHPDPKHPDAPARLAWGLVDGHYVEFGYFDLDELRLVGATPVPN